MTEIDVLIDGTSVVVEEGTTILEAARVAGIAIPTLCSHEKLAPWGGCRLCIVEAEADGARRIVASCVHAVSPGLVVRTRSRTIDGYRKTLLELLLARAPLAPRLRELAREYGAEASRFEKDASFCIHCGLCVRYCAEIKKKNAVGFIERGTRKEISFIPEIASRECGECKECFPLCPTSYLQAAYVLAEALTRRSAR
jgi:NADH dehydrogenase/NADH:ubiquinone oxidoreductase subunit G